MTPVGLHEIATQVLGAVVAFFDSAGVKLPARRYVAAGQPENVAWDDEQVSVTLAALYAGPPSVIAPARFTAGAPCPTLLTADFAVEVVRADPASGITTPSLDVLEASGVIALTDAATLHAALLDVISGRVLERGTQTDLGPVRTIGPEGGFSSARGLLGVGVG